MKNPSKKIIKELIFLCKQGQQLNVVDRVNSLIESYPNSVDLWNVLGAANVGLKRLKEAEKCFEKIVILNPDFTPAHYNLGNILQNQGKYFEAILSYKKAIKTKPDYSEVYYSLGNTQVFLGQYKSAISSYKHAIKINPDYVDAYMHLGNVQKLLGKLSDAISNYKQAIEIKPDYAQCYNNYIDSVKVQYNDPILIKLKKFISKKNISEKDKIYCHFAMGKAQLDLKNFDEGFKFLNIGNKLRKDELKFNIEKYENIFFKIKDCFKNLNLEKDTTNLLSSTNPIFILGMPRSGTTLVEQILSSHSEIQDGGELEFLKNSINSINWQSKKIEMEDIKKIKKEYIKLLEQISKSPYITDKMPLNFQWIGFILYAFPNAKIIHLKRNPMAVCWSNYKLYFVSKDMDFSFNQIDIAKYYKLYENLMEFWHKQFPKKIYDFNYEKLTENQEGQTRKLFDYLGLKWDKEVLNFHRNQRAVKTASSDQVRKNIYKGSSNEWRKYKKWLMPMSNYLNIN